MPDPKHDPAVLWKNQPEEEIRMSPEQILVRRTEALSASTRSEILMSIAAALLLVAVVVLRFGLARNPPQEIGCALVVAWVAITLIRFRGRLWGHETPSPDAIAAAGVEYYRRELERRRDHLRDAWLWHGPLLLACLILAGIWGGWGLFLRAYRYRSLDQVAPLAILLALWVAYGLQRRLRQARQLQREIDDIRQAGSRD